MQPSFEPGPELALPAQTEVEPAAPFPLIASLAPLLAAGIMWALTRSSFVLLFAVLSPVIAVGSMLDSRRQRRRRLRRARAERATSLTELTERVSDELERENSRRWSEVVGLGDLLAARHDEATRWKRDVSSLRATVGAGPRSSGVRVRGVAADDTERQLVDTARTIPHAPVDVAVLGGIGIVGPPPLARALARTVLARVVHAAAPGRVLLTRRPDSAWEWLDALPHRSGTDQREGAELRLGVAEAYAGPVAADPDETLLVLADTVGAVPPSCAAVLEVTGVSSARVLAADTPVGPFVPELTGDAEARSFSNALSALARRAGVGPRGERIPAGVELADLHPERCETGPGLGCVVGVGESGAEWIDLAASGPHAVVGGTTGSGKSEFLVSWVTSMACSRSPEEVAFLLVDFKGGATFTPLIGLPHCVGLLTDLDHGGAQRALESLRAELRYRERALAAAGVARVEALPEGDGPGRLVIVVDEFAAMLQSFPELHALFADLAARGRSLGIHLVLCTQRPAGVVRDALLANCALRLSLRVNDAHDSRAVVGTELAARLPADRPGRLVASVDGRHRVLQVATTTPALIADVARRHRDAPTPRRPWLDPLPARVLLEELPLDDGLRLGLEDVPSRQEQRVWSYRPAQDGHLLIEGPPRSGKSELVHTIVAQVPPPCGQAVAASIEPAWDAVTALAEQVEVGEVGTERLVLLDDLDSLFARFGEEHALAFLDALATVLRDGPSLGVHVVATVQRLPGALRSIESLFTSRASLGDPGAEGDAASSAFDVENTPGAGSWRGHRVQAALAGERAGSHEPTAQNHRDAAAPVLGLPGARRHLVVTRRTARVHRRLTEAGVRALAVEEAAAARGGPGADDPTLRLGDGGTVVVGDVDQWQTHWNLLATLRGDTAIVFDGCTLADVRAVVGSRVLPPPILPSGDRVWVLDELGLRRARWGSPPTSEAGP